MKLSEVHVSLAPCLSVLSCPRAICFSHSMDGREIPIASSPPHEKEGEKRAGTKSAASERPPQVRTQRRGEERRVSHLSSNSLPPFSLPLPLMTYPSTPLRPTRPPSSALLLPPPPSLLLQSQSIHSKSGRKMSSGLVAAGASSSCGAITPHSSPKPFLTSRRYQV